MIFAGKYYFSQKEYNMLLLLLLFCCYFSQNNIGSLVAVWVWIKYELCGNLGLSYFKDIFTNRWGYVMNWVGMKWQNNIEHDLQ